MDAYGFRGAMLVIGGWALHSTVGACLLRPLEDEHKKSIEKVITKKNSVHYQHTNNNFSLRIEENGLYSSFARKFKVQMTSDLDGLEICMTSLIV